MFCWKLLACNVASYLFTFTIFFIVEKQELHISIHIYKYIIFKFIKKNHKDLFMPVHLLTIVMIPYICSDMKWLLLLHMFHMHYCNYKVDQH